MKVFKTTVDKVPSSCADCDIVNNIGYCPLINNKFVGNNVDSRPSYCPLRPKNFSDDNWRHIKNEKCGFCGNNGIECIDDICVCLKCENGWIIAKSEG